MSDDFTAIIRAAAVAFWRKGSAAVTPKQPPSAQARPHKASKAHSYLVEHLQSLEGQEHDQLAQEIEVHSNASASALSEHASCACSCSCTSIALKHSCHHCTLVTELHGLCA